MAKTTKYGALAGVLPKLASDGSADYQAKVSAIKQRIMTREGTQVVFALREAVDQRAAASAEALSSIGNVVRDRPCTAPTLAALYSEVRGAKEELEALLSEANLVLEAVSQCMTDQMEAEDVTSLRLANGRTVSVSLEPYAVVKDKDAVRTWVDGDPDLRKALTLPWQTLNALCKERLLAGEALPQGVEAFMKTKVRLG